MTRNLFSSLRRYAQGAISQDENYVTEALATLLDEFPRLKTTLIGELCGVKIGPEAIVSTQASYETERFGRAVLDLVIEDDDNFLIVEVKVESGLSFHETEEPESALDGQADEGSYNQIAKYEDCVGLPNDKCISIFLLSKYPINLVTNHEYQYFKPETNQVLWRRLYSVANNYYCSLSAETAESYLLGKFLGYLKENGMAGFQGFKFQHLAALSWRAETEALCSDLRTLILENIAIPGFEGKKQSQNFVDGVQYRREQPYSAVFLGLWFSDEGQYSQFRRETGVQVLVAVEADPKNPIRKHLLESEAYVRVSKEFRRQKDGWRILLRHRPLAEFLSSEDQSKSLLEFFKESVEDLEQSGLLELIRSWKP